MTTFVVFGINTYVCSRIVAYMRCVCAAARGPDRGVGFNGVTVPFGDIIQQMKMEALDVYIEAVLWQCSSVASLIFHSISTQPDEHIQKMSYTPKKVDCEVDVDTSALSGKTAIVTGGADGLGRAYVRALHAAG